MADNELKEQLDNLVAGNGNTDIDSFLMHFAYGSNPLDGFDDKDLDKLLTLIPENHKLKADIVERITEKRKELGDSASSPQDQTLENTTDTAEQQTQTDSQEHEPATADSPTSEVIEEETTSQEQQPNTTDSPVTDEELPEVIEEEPEIMEQQPTNTDSPATDEEIEDEPNTADYQVSDDDLAKFATIPSYLLYRESRNLVGAVIDNTRALEDEQLDDKTKGQIEQALEAQRESLVGIMNNSKKIIDLASEEKEITPEQAVFLKDHFEILNSTVDYTGYNKELEAEVDKQLEVFDKENGLDQLEGVKHEELDWRENLLHNVANEYLNTKYGVASNDEDLQVIKNLAVQELKLSPISTAMYELELAAEKSNVPVQALIDLYNKGRMDETLPPEQKQLTDAETDAYIKLRDILSISKDNTEIEAYLGFADRFEELREQFDATYMAELAKLSAEEEFPITDGMSEAEKKKIEEERAKYAADHFPESEDKWIEERALKAFRDKYTDKAGLSDDKIKATPEYDALNKDYEKKAKYVSDAVKTSYVLRVEMLANRSARLTNSPDLFPETKQFVTKFSKEHPEMYGYGKVAVTAGKKVALTQLIAHTAGLNGLAVYSAYNTYKTIKKAYNEYKEKGGEKGLGNFMSYLRKPENRDLRINLMKQAAISGVAIGAAIAGNVTGLGMVGNVAAPVIKSVATSAINVVAEGSKVVGGIKDWFKARKSGNKEEQQAAGKKLKKYWIGLGVAALGAATFGAYKYFSSDDDNSNMSDLDKKLLNESDGKGLSDAEREQLLKNAENLKKDGNVDVTDPLNMKEHAPDTPTATGTENDENTASGTESGAGNATEATQAATDQYANFDLYSDPQTVNNINQFVSYPAFSAQKLHELGLIDEKTADELSGHGGTRKTLAKLRELNENATPEQKAKLAEYKEWINDRDARNAEIIKYNKEHGIGKSNSEHAAKVRAATNAANGSGDASVKSVQAQQLANGGQTQTAPEVKMVQVETTTNKAFAGIITKHGVASDTQEVASSGNAIIDQRNAALAQHTTSGAKHIDTVIKDDKGNVVSSGRYTVRGNVAENDYTLKGKVTTGNQVHEETIKTRGAVTERTYSKGVQVDDINGDGKSDQIVRSVSVGNQQFTAVKGSDGNSYIVDEKGNVQRYDNADKKVHDIAKSARQAKLGRE